MISLIICNKEPGLLNKLSNNIKKTICTEYELIAIDNSQNKYSIFEAYNIGANKARGDIICFCHEDILFKTNNWGQKIISIFNSNAKIGIVGFAGAHFLPDCPMYWSSSPFISEYNLNNDNGQIIEFFCTDYYNEQNIAEAVAVDGLCFFVRRELFEQISFDEKTYKGFHLYDMDICMQAIKAGYKVCVTKDILVEHFWSEKGAAKKAGMELFEHNLSLFCAKWKDDLPIYKGLSNTPENVLTRINRLCENAYEAKKVRKSKAYRIGKSILSPLIFIKKHFS